MKYTTFHKIISLMITLVILGGIYIIVRPYIPLDLFKTDISYICGLIVASIYCMFFMKVDA